VTAVRAKGPMCMVVNPYEIDLGTMCLSRSPISGTVGIVPDYLRAPEPPAPRSLAVCRAAPSTSRTPLTAADFERAAAALGPGVSTAMVRAFAHVESGGKNGFGSDGRPVIAFEGHIFRKYTHKAYDKKYPLLSYPYTQKAGAEWKTNNKDQVAAWATLESAMALDEDAALMACSWGMFQVMGFNYADCGYKSVQSFVAAMRAGEKGQLEAFVGFCKKRNALVTALREMDYVQMATIYNGKDYGDYDKRIEKAYKKYSTPVAKAGGQSP
jgi:hypothetical protein